MKLGESGGDFGRTLEQWARESVSRRGEAPGRKSDRLLLAFLVLEAAILVAIVAAVLFVVRG